MLELNWEDGRMTGADLTVFSENGAHAATRGASRARVAAALLEREGCQLLGASGREPVMWFPLPGGGAVLREYRRGGFVRHFMRDAFLFYNRPRREFSVHAYLYAKGLPVPEPLGVLWERRGVVFRGRIATRHLEAATLLDYIEAHPEGTDDVLRRAGAVIRAMHEAGVFHADLQTRNILVNADGVYLIDFDGAVVKRPLGGFHRKRNLFRLRRSFDKHGISRGLFAGLLEGYGMKRLPRWMAPAYALKARLSDVLFRR